MGSQSTWRELCDYRLMTISLEKLANTRRQFFGTSSLCLAPMALASLAGREASAVESGAGPMPSRQPDFAPRAKYTKRLLARYQDSQSTVAASASIARGKLANGPQLSTASISSAIMPHYAFRTCSKTD